MNQIPGVKSRELGVVISLPKQTRPQREGDAHLPMHETQVRSLGQEDPLDKEIATHSTSLAWKIPWMEEPGRLQSMGSQRVRYNLVTEHAMPLFKNLFIYLSIHTINLVSLQNHDTMGFICGWNRFFCWPC